MEVLEAKPKEEPITVITVRLPQSLHAQLRKQAHDSYVSLNQLCIHRLKVCKEVPETKAKP